MYIIYGINILNNDVYVSNYMSCISIDKKKIILFKVTQLIYTPN